MRKLSLVLFLAIVITALYASSPVVTGKMAPGEYIFINQSSYTVTLIDGTATQNLKPDQQFRSRFTRRHSVNKVQYEPAAHVYPSQSGNTITFMDR
jgi:translation elongation factor P/translation initiation factor 5A